MPIWNPPPVLTHEIGGNTAGATADIYSGTYLLAGINDWGGISPVTKDHINPERPWPNLLELRDTCADAGFELRERFGLYPEYVREDAGFDGFRVMLFQPVLVQFFDGFSHSPMQGLAALQQEAIVGDILDHGVFEDVGGLRHQPLLVDDLQGLQLAQQPFEPLAQSGDTRQQPHQELPTDH